MNTKLNLPKDNFPFLNGGGEMGALMREKSWDSTLLGMPDKWPLQLRQLTATMLTVPSPMLICWGKEYMQLYNDAFRPILGNNKHPQALGIGAKETYAEIWDTIRPLFESVMAGNPVTFQDFKLLMDRNGYSEEVYFDFSYSPIKDETGSVEGILVICSETTAKVTYLTRLAESEQRFKNLVRDASVGIIVLTGEEMRVSIVNEAYARLVGRKSDELINQHLFDIIPETKDYFLPIIEGVKTSGEPLHLNDIPYTVFLEKEKIDGFLNLVYQPYRDEEGTTQGIIVLCQDVTESFLARQKTEESESRLEQKNKELFLINNDLDNFVYTASHDLKSPVSNIEGLLIALKDQLENQVSVVNDDTSNLLALMQESVDRFKATIVDLTNISKISKEVDEGIDEIFLLELLHDVKFSINSEIQQSQAVIHEDFAVTILRFSKKNLKSIVYNLLSNAIKYKHPDRIPDIIVSTRETAGYIIFEVKDNGLGFNEANKSKMFSMFKRFHNHVEGTGIGLYIVKRIIDNAEGKIEIESQEGIGTTFRVYFKN